MAESTVFAKRMKETRENRGLKQKELAEKVGVTPQTISAYEKTGKVPTLDNAITIAQALGVSLDYLCGMAPVERNCDMESLRDIAECLLKISRYIQCYGGVKRRQLTDEEMMEQCGIPDEYRDTYATVAVFTMDNQILAKFFSTKNKLYSLYQDGALNKELYETIIDGQLADLQRYLIREYPVSQDWDNDSDISYIK